MNMWTTAFVEQIEDGSWVISRPNEFKGGAVYIEIDGFSTETEAKAALARAKQECDELQFAEDRYAAMCESARM